MTRKKRTQEEQPLTTEVVGAKKKSPKKKKAVEEKPVVVQEQEASVNEPTTQEDVAENTPEKRENTIAHIIVGTGRTVFIRKYFFSQQTPFLLLITQIVCQQNILET